MMNSHTIDDKDIEVIKLRCANLNRFQIAAKSGTGEAGVSRSLDKWRGLIGEDVMDVLQKIGRIVRKSRQGQALPGPKEMGAALDIVEVSGDNNIPPELARDFLNETFRECQSQSVNPCQFVAAARDLMAESIRENRPLRDIASEMDQNIKQKASVEGELTSIKQELAKDSALLPEVQQYRAVKQKLAERGSASICKDPEKMANFLANMDENNSDLQIIASTIASTKSIKADKQLEEDELKLITQQKTIEKKTFEALKAKGLKEKEATDGVRQLQALGMEMDDIATWCEVVKEAKIPDPKQFIREIQPSGGLVQARQKIGSEVAALTEERDRKQTELAILSDNCARAVRYRDYLETQVKCFHYQKELVLFTQALAGIGKCTPEQVVKVIALVIEGGLKLLPRYASSRSSLKQTLWSVENDLTIRRSLQLW